MLKENKKTQKTQRIFAGAISFTIDDAYQQTEKTKKAIVNAIIVGAFVLFLGAIYEDWCQMFYEFGQNLYHWLNK